MTVWFDRYWTSSIGSWTVAWSHRANKRFTRHTQWLHNNALRVRCGQSCNRHKCIQSEGHIYREMHSIRNILPGGSLFWISTTNYAYRQYWRSNANSETHIVFTPPLCVTVGMERCAVAVSWFMACRVINPHFEHLQTESLFKRVFRGCWRTRASNLVLVPF